MAASTCCSAPTRSARSICARRHRERLTITLAPVGPQAPPALRSARLGGGRCAARGSLLWTTGTSCAGVNPSTMSPNTCPPCLQPLQPFRGEREGPAQREGEVGGAASPLIGPLTLPSPPAGGGEGEFASFAGWAAKQSC